MKKITNHLKVFALIILVSANASFAQLTGIKTIPGTYASIALAIADLNTQGVGAGGVTFNVTAGHTETAVNLIITATGTSANPIVFQKSGAGANPLVTAGAGGGTADGIIELQGTDYITFNAIDLMEDAVGNITATTRMEWGYGVCKNTNNDGCNNVTIRNCNISLNTGGLLNPTSVGIEQGNHTPISTAALAAPTMAAGRQNNNKYFSNIISYCMAGIRLTGYGSLAYQDAGTEVGVSGGNTISNIGGGGATCYAIYASNQDAIKIDNNIISNVTNGTTFSSYGIYNSSTFGTIGATTECAGNSVTNFTTTCTTGALYGMYIYTQNDKNVFNNTLNTFSNAGTGAVYGMYLYYNSNIANIYQNSITNISSVNGTVVTGLLQQSSNCCYTINVYNNKIGGISTSSASAAAKVEGLNIQGSGTTLNLYYNIIGDLSATSATNATLSLVGIDLSSMTAATAINLYYNSVYIAGAGGVNFGTVGIYESTTPTTTLIDNIIVNNCTPSGTGRAIAHYRTTATQTTYSSTSNNNLFYAGTPGASNLLYFDGTNSDQTITAYQTRMSPGEANSVSENPPFVSTTGSNANFLHLVQTSATLAESGGVEISGYTADYDAAGTRPAGGYPKAGQVNGGGLKPDIGADEADATLSPMIYVSSTTTQVSGIVSPGSVNVAIIRMDVYTAGYTPALNATQFTVNANGTTDITHINGANAKIYYTGTSSTFATTTLFGSAVPTIANFNVNGNQALQHGMNYFWLTYDLSAAAVCTEYLDGECASLVTGGTSHIPLLNAPSGSRDVVGGCGQQAKFQMYYGGTGDDNMVSSYMGEVSTTADGGYIMIASSDSWNTPGNFDMYVVKVNANGTKQWSKVYDLGGGDYGSGIKQTRDGGYVMVGMAAGSDGYLIKTDASGNKQWSINFTGSGEEGAREVIETAGGNYMVLGWSDTPPSAGWIDPFIAKVSSTGTVTWINKYASTAYEDPYAMDYSLDGSAVVITGERTFLLKVDTNGNMLWNYRYDDGDCWDVKRTADGGYIMTVRTNTTPSYTEVIKTDGTGAVQISRRYGGTWYDDGLSIAQTSDGSYLISTGQLSSGSCGVVSKTDATLANISFSNTVGLPQSEVLNDIKATADGGFVAFGYTFPAVGLGGGSDLWLAKGDADDLTGCNETPFSWSTNNPITITPYSPFSVIAGVPAYAAGSETITPVSTDPPMVLCLTPLPIELLSFSARADNENHVLIRWTTASENNSGYFEIERSSGGQDFESIGTVQAAGNSDSRLDYSFPDLTPFTGTNYYRLKQVDYDGKYTFSGIASVTIRRSEHFGINIFPNPASSVLNCEVFSKRTGTLTLKVTDLLGKTAVNTEIPATAMKHTLDISRLPRGVYILKVSNGVNEEQVKFIKQ